MPHDIIEYSGGQRTTKGRYLVENPWTDKQCQKNGLCNLYIIDTVKELLRIYAELEPGVTLNKQNPFFVVFHTKIDKLLKEPNQDNFQLLIDFVDDYLQCKWSLVRFDSNTVENMPDIRLAETEGEALGWLAYYLKLTV